MEPLSFSERSGPRIVSVSELTAEIEQLLSSQFDDVRVAGEISGVKISAGGHAWFTLKDKGASIRCVIWKSALRMMRFKPEDGLAVVARGGVDVWAERGEYQLIVSALEPQGYGALQLAFEQLKRALEEEGLFAAERKRPLPAFPRRIGIVTSPTGAVIQDMLSVLARRWPGLHIRLYPTLVQGEGAAEGIAEGLEYFSRSGWAEVVIVGRGGGSLEDLWAFNEEIVARAIAASAAPVVSAVGHETDFTIADFVADFRAPTPSAAAELVVRDVNEVEASIRAMQQRAERSIRLRIAGEMRRLHERGIERAHRLLERRIGRSQQRVEELDNRLRRFTARVLDQRRRRVEELSALVQEQDPRVRLARARASLGELRQRAERAVRLKVTLAQRRLSELGIEKAQGIVERRIAGARQRVEELKTRLRRIVARLLEHNRRQLHEASMRLREHDPRVGLAYKRAQFVELEQRLSARATAKLAALRRAAEPLSARLEALSPLRVLERGYSIVQADTGSVIRRAADAPPGSRIRVRLHEGRLGARVEESEDYSSR